MHSMLRARPFSISGVQGLPLAPIRGEGGAPNGGVVCRRVPSWFDLSRLPLQNEEAGYRREAAPVLLTLFAEEPR